MTKWNKYKNYKKHREHQLIFKIRQAFANAAQVPYDLIFNHKKCTSDNYFKQLKEINSSIKQDLNSLTKHLPRKLKKKYRKYYKWTE